MRRLLLIAIFVAATMVSARSEPDLPRIATAALAYRQSLTAPSNGSVSSLLAAIRRAETEGNLPQAVRLYEGLVALQPENFRSWLKLGLAWKEVDGAADGGVNAAWNSYRSAATASDKVEALLLMTSVLRTQLAAASESYESSRVEVAALSTALTDERRGTEIPCPTSSPGAAQATNSTDRTALQCVNRARATEEMNRSAKRVGAIAHDLDEVYADISSKFPGLEVQKLQDADKREKQFGPTLVPSSGGVNFSFKLIGGTTRTCVEFTQELNPDASVYSHLASAKFEAKDAGNTNTEDGEAQREEKPRPSPEDEELAKKASNYSISVDGKQLCFDNLAAGLSYSLVLKKGLPSKLGTKLANEVKQGFTVPDYPKQIRFSGGRFVLPRSGGGRIEVHATNLKKFNLELYRISDRTLYRQIALGLIGGPRGNVDTLPEDEYSGLKDHFGELMWRGSLEMPRGGKPDESVAGQLRFRDLLEQRRNWIREQVAKGRASGREPMLSGVRPQFAATEDEAGLSGQFEGDNAEFERVTGGMDPPGVYALIAQTADQDRCDKQGAESKELCDRPVQWLVLTDIGVTFYEGADQLSVALRSLQTGEAVRAKVQLVTAGNRVLGQETQTDEFGVARFPRSLALGTQSNALSAIMAESADDFAFIPFNAERLDLSKLNVQGRSLPEGMDAFLTTDRGLYEPGQAIELVALLRDAAGRASESPVNATIRMESRGRVLAPYTVDPQEWKLGGLRRAITVPKDARSGPVRITLSLGEDERKVVGETIVHVGPIAPDRVEIQFPDSEKAWFARVTDGKLQVKGRIAARYLFAAGFAERFGAAKDLKVEAVARISAGETPKPGCYEDFAFGHYDDAPIAVTSRPYSAVTDEKGWATLNLSDIDVPVATKPGAVAVEVTVYNSSGPLGASSLTLSIDDDKGWLGVGKAPKLHSDPTTGKLSLDLDVVRLTAGNLPESEHTLEVSLARERDVYNWESKTDGGQQYRRASFLDQPFFAKTLSTSELAKVPAGGAPACVQREAYPNLIRDIDVGRYVLSVRDVQTDRLTSIRIQIGASQTDPDRLEPNIYVLSSDKDVYKLGETIEFTAETPFDGPVLLALAQGDVEQWAEGRAEHGVAKIRFRPPPDWGGKGFYALATVFRAEDKDARNIGPDRAIGARFVEVSGAPQGFTAKIELIPPAGVRALAPDQSLGFRVCVGDAGINCNSASAASSSGISGDVYAVAYVVDQGLLGLTGHNTARADPEAHFFGQRRLDVRLMDTYSRLLPATGGDRPGRLALANYTADHVVSFAQGPVKLQGGRGEFRFDNLGLAAGKLSIYVLVWSKDYVTTASSDKVSTYSPVVLDLGAPRFLLAGDHAIAPLRIVNLAFDHTGDFQIRVSAKGAAAKVGFIPEGSAKTDEASSELRFPLGTGSTKSAALMIEPDRTGRGKLSVAIDVTAVDSPFPLDGSHREWTIDIGAPTLSSVRTVSFPLDSKAVFIPDLIRTLIADNYDPATVSITARFADSAMALLDLSPPAHAAESRVVLDRLALRAMAFFADRQGAADPARRPEGERLLGDILSLQVQNGSFQPYRTRQDPNAYEFFEPSRTQYTEAGFRTAIERNATILDVFSLAQNAGYKIPAASLDNARVFVRSTIDDAAGATPTIRCSFEALHATLALIDTGEMEDAEVDKILECGDRNGSDKSAQPTPEQEAVTAAIAARSGRSDSANVILANFALDAKPGFASMSNSELGQLRLAMMANFLKRAGAPEDVQQAVAASLLDADRKSISPAALAWIARDSALPSRSTLDLASLHVDGTGLGDIHVAGAGVLESERVSLQRLSETPTSVSVSNRGRGSITIEGVLSNPRISNALPPKAVRRRIFDADTGKEIDLKTTTLKVGDRTRDRIGRRQGEAGQSLWRGLPARPKPKRTVDPRRSVAKRVESHLGDGSVP